MPLPASSSSSSSVVGPERITFCRPLHLDEQARTRHHDVHVHAGAGVLGVVEVDHRDAVDQSDGHSADRINQRKCAQLAGRDESCAGVVQGDEGARDRGSPCAPVGLQDVAVQDDQVLAQRRQVADRTQ